MESIRMNVRSRWMKAYSLEDSLHIRIGGMGRVEVHANGTKASLVECSLPQMIVTLTATGPPWTISPRIYLFIVRERYIARRLY